MSGKLTSFLGVLFILCSCRSTTSSPTEVKPAPEGPAAAASGTPHAAPTAPSAPSAPTAATALSGPCSLLEPRARTDRDWRREATQYFEAEHLGLLFRIDRPGAELDAVKKKGFDQFREGLFVFEPCPSAILVFTRAYTSGPQCTEGLPDYIPTNVGPVTKLHCFDRKDFRAEAARDCIDDVIPKEKCRAVFEPSMKQAHCGGRSRAENDLMNELAIHLGFAPPGSRTCID